jgi:hypothetical protein
MVVKLRFVALQELYRQFQFLANRAAVAFSFGLAVGTVTSGTLRLTRIWKQRLLLMVVNVNPYL